VEDAAPIPYQHRFVVQAGTAKAMARAFVRYRLGQLHVRLVFLGLWLVATLLLFLSYDADELSAGARLYGGLFYGLLFTLIVLAIGMALTYVATRRLGRGRITEGAVLETGFGDDAVVISRPGSSGRTAYSVIRAVDVRKGFVFVRFDGNPVTNIYPRELFPDDALARLRQAGVAVTPQRPPISRGASSTS
jgi:hypothetical protein